MQYLTKGLAKNIANIPVIAAATIFLPSDGFSPGLRLGHKEFLTYHKL
jgi:hypothetical protein